MATASDIVRSALERIGVVPIGETVPTEHSTRALADLNDMIQHWAAEGLELHAFTQYDVTLVSGQATYTIGASGNFNVRRPVQIESAYLTSGGVYYPLNVYNSSLRYDEYTVRPSGLPTEVYYDPQYPLGKIVFYLTPNAAYSVHLATSTSLAELTLLADTVSLPPEYNLALWTNLAVLLMPTFGKSDNLLIKLAKDAKGVLATNNSKRFIKEARFDDTLLNNSRMDASINNIIAGA